MSYNSIIDEIKTLSIEERLALLESVSRMIREELNSINSTTSDASEVRRLPLEERKQILAESAQFALADYETGSELTEFSEDLAGDQLYDYEER